MRPIFGLTLFLSGLALFCPSRLLAQAPETLTPGTYLLVRAATADTPVIPNALLVPSPISVERITVTKDTAGRLLVASEEAPETVCEVHQVENFLQFTLVRSQPRQKVLQAVTYLCNSHPHPDGALSGAFSALGRNGGTADGLGGGFKREGSFLLYPQRAK